MKKILVLFSLTLIVRTGIACSCDDYESDFYENISHSTHYCVAVFDTLDYSYENNEYMVEAGYFVLLDTIGAFDTAIGDTILVLGQDGINCGEDISKFSIGDTVLLAFYYKETEALGKETFHLSGLCGKHYLEITEGQNNGLSVSEIKQKIKSIITTIDVPSIDQQLTIYPNPVGGEFALESSNNPIVGIKIYDYTGRLLLEENINKQSAIVDANSLKPGFYNILILTGRGPVFKKIIKE